MGTYINLMLNKTTIDYGKNRNFNKHGWLFLNNSRTNIEYEYADSVIEVKEGFSIELNKALFRMNHLGFSLKECQMKYNKQLDEWNRVNNLNLSFEYLIKKISEVDLSIVTDNYMFNLNPHIFSIREYLISQIKKDIEFRNVNMDELEDSGFSYYDLEDFLLEVLDVKILLRMFCENENNLLYNLEWQYQDIIESGWVSYEDIIEIDHKDFIINHNKIYGELQAIAINVDQKNYYAENFNKWLVDNGFVLIKEYKKLTVNGSIMTKKLTLPVFVRNVIHHPENENNTFSNEELNDSITQMLKVLECFKL